MSTFLQQVASYICSKHSQHLNEVLILMPNRRSCLYLEKDFHRVIQSPVSWLPKIKSLKDWIAERSELVVADEVVLIFELYKAYREVVADDTITFDQFYHLGSILLNDFNEIDSEWVDAEKFFQNLAEWEQLGEQFSIEEELKNILSQYRQIVDGKEFLNKYTLISKHLYRIYDTFTRRILEKKIAYDGYLLKHFIQQELANTSLPKYVYAIGFNALTKAEEKILEHIRDNSHFTYLWDYDNYYVQNELSTAGLYLRNWLKKYPNPEDFKSDTDNLNNVAFNIYEFVNETEQVKYLPVIFDALELSEENPNTVLVLANESLLPLVLNSLPDSVKRFNVTMGYSLKYTQTYGFLKLLVKWSANKSTSYVPTNHLLELLYHPFLADKKCGKELNDNANKNNEKIVDVKTLNFTGLSDEFKHFITKQYNNFYEYAEIIISLFKSIRQDLENKTENPYLVVEKQAIDRLLDELSGFLSLCKKEGIELGIQTGNQILMQMAGRLKVDLIGEPIEGLQIMGLMETRLLDFNNVIVLSASEDNLPSDYVPQTFILHAFRHYYGLSTAERRESVYAYHFYRLAQRAKQVFLTYSTLSNDKPVDKSPYIRQIEYFHQQCKTKKITIPFNIKHLNPPIEIKKKEVRNEWEEFLHHVKQKGISRKVLSDYLLCKLQFAYRYLLKLEPKEIFVEPIDVIELGNILHAIIEKLFVAFNNKDLTKDDLEQMRSQIELIADECVKKDDNDTLDSKIQLMQVTKMIDRFLLAEKERDRYPAKPLINTNTLSCDLSLSQGSIKLAGIPDLILENSNAIYIIDFKTSKSSSTVKIASIDDFFKEEKKYSYAFQLMFYGFVYFQYQQQNHQPINKQILLENIYFNKSRENGQLTLDNKPFDLIQFVHDLNQQFTKILEELMFDDNLSFSQTNDIKNCEYCEFNVICKRNS